MNLKLSSNNLYIITEGEQHLQREVVTSLPITKMLTEKNLDKIGLEFHWKNITESENKIF